MSAQHSISSGSHCNISPDLCCQLDQARDENESQQEAHTYGDAFRTPLFEFVRQARGIDALADATPAQALEIFEAWLLLEDYDDIHEAWLSEFANSLVEEPTLEDIRAEVLDLWERVKYPPGSTPPEAAWKRSQRYRLQPKNPRSPGYVNFISLAGNLQFLQGENNILLPCHLLGRVLNVSAMTISRYCGWAKQDGFLIPVSSHEFHSSGVSRAAEFRFALDHFPAKLREGVNDEIERPEPLAKRSDADGGRR